MYIREYGNAHKKDLLFFPGSCEPWQEFAGAAEELAQSFHVLLVVPDGQDPDEHTDFISMEKTVEDTDAWLKTQGIRRNLLQRRWRFSKRSNEMHQEG